jgi:antitoxin HicB
MAIAARVDAPPRPEVDARVRELLERPYRMVIRGDTEEGYLAEAPELPGCFTAGDTPEEALELLRGAMYAWLLVRVEQGFAIPDAEPEQDYSGKFIVRLPKTLHRELAKQAEREGVSLNALVSTYLAREAGLEAAQAIA